jgi:shikimate dehydrogenase
MGLHTESITGCTGILGILADPIARVRTPELVNAALAVRRLYGKYLMIPMHVTESHLARYLAGLRHMENFHGAVVMPPHKRNILEHLDHVSPEAEQVGACNVIHRNARGYLSGSTCDGEGFILGLQESGFTLTGARCLLVGTGGVGPGIAFALARREVESIHILSRTPPNARELAARVRQAYPGARLTASPSTAHDFDLVINVTSLGLNPDDPMPLDVDLITEQTVVADIVIGPEPTALLRHAMSIGCATCSGHEMLSAQIELMVDFMTGENPPIELSKRLYPEQKPAQ